MNKYIILAGILSVCIPLLYWIIGKWVDFEVSAHSDEWELPDEDN